MGILHFFFFFLFVAFFSLIECCFDSKGIVGKRNPTLCKERSDLQEG